VNATVRILAIDHDPGSLAALVRALHPYEVASPPAGSVLETYARELRPDLVLVDLDTSSQDAVEVTRRFKSDPATSRLPLLITAASSRRSDVARALQNGADDHVTKPFHHHELHSRVRNLIENHRLRATLDGQTAGVSWSDLLIGLCPEITSHLAVIRDSTEVIARTAGESGRNQLDRVLAATRRISDLVNALQACAGPRTRQHRPTDLADVLRRAAQVTQGSLAQGGVWIEVDDQLAPLMVITDGAHLLDAFTGALLATTQLLPAGGRVAIRGSVRGDGIAVEFDCCADGPRARSLLGRVGPAKVADEPGTPRDEFAVVRMIVEEHGGRFFIEDRAGGGSIVRFELPDSPDLD